MSPFKENGSVMKILRLVMELNDAKHEVERLRRENLELVNEVRILKLKDIVHREHGNKRCFVRYHKGELVK
jgi:hypothetical protein